MAEPRPRAIVRTADFHEVREVRRAMRQSGWRSSVDRAFGEVIGHVGHITPRHGSRRR
ncbi:MAG: hypothetical protein H0V45_15265 [Actinobacteria bacterium]|nr:hypothetical protein [Actinomycetota bacterium]